MLLEDNEKKMGRYNSERIAKTYWKGKEIAEIAFGKKIQYLRLT